MVCLYLIVTAVFRDNATIFFHVKRLNINHSCRAYGTGRQFIEWQRENQQESEFIRRHFHYQPAKVVSTELEKAISSNKETVLEGVKLIKYVAFRLNSM